MKRALIATLAALVLTALMPAAASANTYRSEIVVTGSSFNVDEASAHGLIESGRPACLRNRRVKISARVNGEIELLRPDVSSLNGFWGGSGAVSEFPDSLAGKLLPKRLGKKHRCAGDRDSYAPFRLPAAAPISLRRQSFETVINYFSLTYGGGDETGGEGFLTSPRKSCLPSRRVAFYVLRHELKAKLTATDRSSRNGYFGGIGPPGGDGIRIKVSPRKLRGGDRCESAKYSYSF